MTPHAAVKVDLAKRRRVMDRSRKLGHCICDPRRSCPCDVFRSQGICPCAGERPAPLGADQVRLTQWTHSPGCASKIPPAELEMILARLPAVEDDAVVSGLAAGDDAGIYRLPSGQHLVQTVDVMTPVVDDPDLFGRICAANCLSDIYAMGGQPRTALSIVAFPSDRLDGNILHRMLSGAMEVLAEAGVALIGGHSIQDQEVKLGFAITGLIDPGRATSHETARAGDLLVLTKALGTGVVGFCRQIGRAIDTAAAEASMAILNREAAEAAAQAGVSACTDVTGFGLLGHLARMARHSGVTVELLADALPALPGVREALRDDVTPGAIERNREFVADDLEVQDGVEEAAVLLGLDAQTSGGLLISVPAERHEALVAALRQRGAGAWTIGRVVAKSRKRIRILRGGWAGQAGVQDAAPQAAPAPPAAQPCCPEAPGRATAQAPAIRQSGEAAVSAQAFGQLMASTAAPGVLDARTKQLINYALAVMARCGPCAEAMTDKALHLGLTSQQLEEAAWCAAAMGGAPVKMFCNEVIRQAKAKEARGCCS